MLKASFYISLATIFSLTFAGATRAAKSEGEATARQGVVRCGGNNFLRLSNTEIHFTSYFLRNFDSTEPIIIDRMRFFDATGAILLDSAVSGLPRAQNGILLGGSDNTLNPNETARFDSDDILPFLSPLNRPIQLEIEWSSNKAALTLDVSLAEISRERNPAGGTSGGETSC